MKIKITFIEELLGTASANPDIHREFIASKAPHAEGIEEEVAAIGVEAAVDKAMTVFPRTTAGSPHLWDYQIKGFFKDACGSLTRVPGTISHETKAYKKVIDGTIFVAPRVIPVAVVGVVGNCQRPLRADTAQGPRIALANSETIAAGSTIECDITIMNPAMGKLIRELLDYGKLRGLGQWRNSGKGRFTWEEIR